MNPELPNNLIVLPGGRCELPPSEPIEEEVPQGLPTPELLVPAVEAVLFSLGEPVGHPISLARFFKCILKCLKCFKNVHFFYCFKCF